MLNLYPRRNSVVLSTNMSVVSNTDMLGMYEYQGIIVKYVGILFIHGFITRLSLSRLGWLNLGSILSPDWVELVSESPFYSFLNVNGPDSIIKGFFASFMGLELTWSNSTELHVTRLNSTWWGPRHPLIPRFLCLDYSPWQRCLEIQKQFLALWVPYRPLGLKNRLLCYPLHFLGRDDEGCFYSFHLLLLLLLICWYFIAWWVHWLLIGQTAN